jgi:protein arginine kinase
VEVKELVGHLLGGLGSWLAGDGPESGIVLSTRVRLARNIAGVPFWHRAAREQRHNVIETVRAAVGRSSSLGGASICTLEIPQEVEDKERPPLERQFLLERHLISREMAARDGESAIVVHSGESVSIMLNEEDHIRMQVLGSGFCLEDTWRRIDGVDDELNETIEYAFSPRWGYLTACPTNVGTGMRASVMLHLPAQVTAKRVPSLLQNAARSNCAVRGMYGEGSNVIGDFFQVSNQATLGQSEEEIIETTDRIVRDIISEEMLTREDMLKHNRRQLEDRVCRAVGTLENARLMGTEELMQQLSWVRLGVCLCMAPRYSIATINRLMIEAQPAHIQLREGRTVGPLERDAMRADLVRALLGKKEMQQDV